MFSFCISGGFGVDFSSDPDELEQGLKTVAKGLLQHGVTSYCPTIVTSSQESYSEVNKYINIPLLTHAAQLECLPSFLFGSGLGKRGQEFVYSIYDLLVYQLAICINFNVSFGLQISKKIKRTPGGVDGAEILGKATDMYMTKTNNQKNNKRMPSLKLGSALAELIEGGMVWTLHLAVQIIALVEITLFSQCFSSLTWWHCIDFCVEPYGRLGCIQNGGEGGREGLAVGVEKSESISLMVVDLIHT